MGQAPSNLGPLHGYRGADSTSQLNPCRFVIALNRLAGANGSSIATEAGARLGWPVYTPEMIDFMARDDAARQELLQDVSAPNQLWIEHQVDRWQRERQWPADSDSAAIARLILILAVRGQAVIIGRAAGYLLPAATTLHVRIVAPWPGRVAYFAQWLRLTEAEALEELKNRDARRASFLKPFTDISPEDLSVYDLVINSGRMKLSTAADLIVLSAQAKQKLWETKTDSVEGVPVV